MKILIINGPNLNMLGVREPEIYGTLTLAQIEDELRDFVEATGSSRAAADAVELEFFQSNHEGAIVDKIQEALGHTDGILINPAAYTHTSIAIADAIAAVALPAVEVHISDIESREEFRKHSFIAPKCIAQISGHGANSYRIGLETLIEHIENAK